jgi:hypothetical protein
MPISNNKQLKYREGKTAWECGILPRDNLSHLGAVLLKATLLETHRFLNKIYRIKLCDTEPADFAPLYTYKS